jgi:ABC-type polysaccharide/polyol phosphate export permease
MTTDMVPEGQSPAAFPHRLGVQAVAIAAITNQRLTPPVPTASQDLVRGFLQWPLWGRLGWLEVKRRYRRTVIGPFWSSISLTIYVIAVGILGAGLWNQSVNEYLPFLVSGMLAWMFVSTVVIESCGLFINGSDLFGKFSFDYSLLAYALVWRNLITFLHNLIVYLVIVLLLAPQLITATSFLVIPGMFLLLVGGVAVALLCGMLCLRFRDVTQVIANIMQIALLITPIFWPPSSLEGRSRFIFVDFNPFYRIVDVVRRPLLGSAPTFTSYAAVVGMLMLAWIVAYIAFRRFRHRIAYWA